MERERARVADLVEDLAARLGTAVLATACIELLRGAPRERYLEELRGLTGHDWLPGDAVLDRARWGDHWVRSWGARGLLHVWHDGATSAVVEGLRDEHWRPAEMCLKVVARHDVAGAGDGAAALVGHGLSRVRAQALRALAVVGDTEHVAVVEAALGDPDPDVRRRAELSLEALAGRLGR
ncbi:MAG: HEAT repeat domain-containing protein [Nocardioides sp.]